MTLLLRKVNRNRWIDQDLSWLEDGEFQSDVLIDLRTSSNCLSVFLIEDDKSNFERIVAAIGSSAQKIDVFDYVLFSDEIIDKLSISIDKSLGSTKDEYVNKTWHLDFVDLSAQKVLKIAKELLSNSEKKRIPHKEVAKFISIQIEKGNIEEDRLEEKIRQKISLN